MACDYHTHTCFSDGADTPEDMVRAALALNMEAIGFSDHSWTGFDPECGIPPAREQEYRRTVNALKERYRGRIRILCGIEQDLYSDRPAEGYDYIIGSVHYVLRDGEYIPVDNTPALLREGIDRHFGGDGLALAEAYWALTATLPAATGCSLIGHLDLVRKFNRSGDFFDESAPRYRRAAIDAVDALLAAGLPFEINTGAISRGYQDTPYPASALIDYIEARGGRFVMSSDSHRAGTLCFGFDRFRTAGCMERLPEDIRGIS